MNRLESLGETPQILRNALFSQIRRSMDLPPREEILRIEKILFPLYEVRILSLEIMRNLIDSK